MATGSLVWMVEMNWELALDRVLKRCSCMNTKQGNGHHVVYFSMCFCPPFFSVHGNISSSVFTKLQVGFSVSFGNHRSAWTSGKMTNGEAGNTVPFF